MKNKHQCRHCSLEFEEKPSCANVYCSSDCYHAFKRANVDSWFGCSVCIASIGFGCKTAGKLLGVNHHKVLGAWKKKGVMPNLPSMGSWRLYALRKAKGKNTERKRTACEIAYDKARMDDIKQACKRGFDWSYEWVKERTRRTANAKYNAMTPEAKKNHNKRCQVNRKKRWAKEPEKKAKARSRISEWKKKNPEKNRESIKKSNKKRRSSDPAYRALCNQRRRFRDIMKSVRNGGTGSYSDKIGCNSEQFRKHMESNFSSKMSWDNYGTYWHVDHVLPCASFDHSDKKQVEICWHWTNLQPLEAKRNLAKSDNIEDPQMSLMIDFVFDA